MRYLSAQDDKLRPGFPYRSPRRRSGGRRARAAAVATLLAGCPFIANSAATAAGSPSVGLAMEPATSGPFSVTLVAQPLHFPQPPTSYKWTFGDGQTSITSVPTVIHVYPGPGKFATSVDAIDQAGLGSATTGILTVAGCASGVTCSAQAVPSRGIELLSVTGSTVSQPPSGLAVMTSLYKIPGCQSSLAPVGSVADSGFLGSLSVKTIYTVPAGRAVGVTCFESTVAFVDLQGKSVLSGALPSCSSTAPQPPCVVSVASVPVGTQQQVTKVILIPPGDPKIGAL